MQKKVAMFLLLFNLYFAQVFSQLSLNDLTKCTKVDRDSFVEFLMSKGFNVIATPGYWLGPGGTFFDEVTLSSDKYQGGRDFIFVDLAQSKKDSEGRVLVQNRSFEFEFRGNTYASYKKIHSEIKARYQKIDFFLNYNTSTYVAKYKAGEYFIYVGDKLLYDSNGRILNRGWIAFENYSNPFNVPK